MANLKEAAKRAVATRGKRDKRDRELAEAIAGGECKIGPVTLRPPTLYTMLVLEDFGNLEALTQDKVSLSAVVNILAIIDLTSEPGKLNGTREDKAQAITERAEAIARQIPMAEAPDFILEAIRVIAAMLTPPQEGGVSDKPFPQTD